MANKKITELETLVDQALFSAAWLIVSANGRSYKASAQDFIGGNLGEEFAEIKTAFDTLDVSTLSNTLNTINQELQGTVNNTLLKQLKEIVGDLDNLPQSFLIQGATILSLVDSIKTELSGNVEGTVLKDINDVIGDLSNNPLTDDILTSIQSIKNELEGSSNSLVSTLLNVIATDEQAITQASQEGGILYNENILSILQAVKNELEGTIDNTLIKKIKEAIGDLDSPPSGLLTNTDILSVLDIVKNEVIDENGGGIVSKISESIGDFEGIKEQDVDTISSLIQNTRSRIIDGDGNDILQKLNDLIGNPDDFLALFPENSQDVITVLSLIKDTRDSIQTNLNSVSNDTFESVIGDADLYQTLLSNSTVLSLVSSIKNEIEGSGQGVVKNLIESISTNNDSITLAKQEGGILHNTNILSILQSIKTELEGSVSDTLLKKINDAIGDLTNPLSQDIITSISNIENILNGNVDNSSIKTILLALSSDLSTLEDALNTGGLLENETILDSLTSIKNELSGSSNGTVKDILTALSMDLATLQNALSSGGVLETNSIIDLIQEIKEELIGDKDNTFLKRVNDSIGDITTVPNQNILDSITEIKNELAGNVSNTRVQSIGDFNSINLPTSVSNINNISSLLNDIINNTSNYSNLSSGGGSTSSGGGRKENYASIDFNSTGTLVLDVNATEESFTKLFYVTLAHGVEIEKIEFQNLKSGTQEINEIILIIKNSSNNLINWVWNSGGDDDTFYWENNVEPNLPDSVVSMFNFTYIKSSSNDNLFFAKMMSENLQKKILASSVPSNLESLNVTSDGIRMFASVNDYYPTSRTLNGQNINHTYIYGAEFIKCEHQPFQGDINNDTSWTPYILATANLNPNNLNNRRLYIGVEFDGSKYTYDVAIAAIQIVSYEGTVKQFYNFSNYSLNQRDLFETNQSSNQLSLKAAADVTSSPSVFFRYEYTNGNHNPSYFTYENLSEERRPSTAFRALNDFKVLSNGVTSYGSPISLLQNGDVSELSENIVYYSEKEGRYIHLETSGAMPSSSYGYSTMSWIRTKDNIDIQFGDRIHLLYNWSTTFNDNTKKPVIYIYYAP